MASAPKSRPQPRQVIPPSSESLAIQEHAKSMDGVAEAMMFVAAEMKLGREQAKPMHDFFAGAGDALDCARKRAAKWGPWFLGSMPFVISLINGVSPQAAKLVQVVVTAMSGTP